MIDEHEGSKVTTPVLWHQLVVRDPEGLSGRSVHAFIKKVTDRKGLKWVRVGEAACTSQEFRYLSQQVVSLEVLLSAIIAVVQFDWALFFFYQGFPEAEIYSPEMTDRQMIELADLAVRLVDNTYFYIYIRNPQLASQLLSEYPASEHAIKRLGELDIPY